ncbi:YmaF family protein [Bacillus sp. 03113]|uniref:YmaF family protein n=1 Tax=Bacillus sp. 03113 TaxID=2578211 RepID=UPI00114300DC|nr:YmaF family protein [Bacillus sp. 03113]
MVRRDGTKTQTHVHEFLGSTKLAEEDEERYNHRFAGVTGEAIPRGRSHFHEIETNTDFFDHHHEVVIRTGPAIPVGNGKHVHFVEGMTTVDDEHDHDFEFATLIDKPLI